jgi:3-deoxy-D-manno-octulosonic-acid transferase
MLILYNLGIYVYQLTAKLISPIHRKAGLFVQGQKASINNISTKNLFETKTVWFHVSSLGEFEQGRPLIEAIKAKFPEKKIVLSFFSPSGYEIRKNYALADYVCYLPADKARNAKKFIDWINPEMSIFVKYDFWYHYLNQLHKKNIPTYLISGLFRKNQLFFKSYGRFYKKMLSFFTHFFVQNQESVELLTKYGFTNVSRSSDTRFDRVFSIGKQAEKIAIAAAFKNHKKLVVAGSSWPPDEKHIIDYINNNQADTKYIIAPHEISKNHIIQIENQLKKSFIRYSNAHIENVKDVSILIIDNVGMLSSLYQYGEIAYIGGGFGSGIHNTMEPATFGLAIIFGPKYQKFEEAKEMISHGGAVSIKSTEQLNTQLNYWLEKEDARMASGEKNKQYIEKNTGATHQILKCIFSKPE